MKQNEKFLVYAVTGFLVVILAVAILFGKETPRRLPEGQQPGVLAVAPPSLEDMLNRRAAPPTADLAQAAAGAADPKADPAAAAVPQPSPAGTPAAGAPVVPTIDQPLVANVQLLPPSPTAQVTEKLGLNRVERGYRIVRARAGDSLGALVQKWCGQAGDYLEQAKGLNEELTTLRVGQEIVLPLVEDEVLLAAYETRGVAVPAADHRAASDAPVAAIGDRSSAGSAEPVHASILGTAPVATSQRKYKIKAGEALWKVAEREVGRKLAPRFLEDVRALNPGLDTDRIREGQEIVLPAKAN